MALIMLSVRGQSSTGISTVISFPSVRKFRCRAKLSQGYSSTRPCNWTTVLVPVYQHKRGIDLLTEVRLSCDRWWCAPYQFDGIAPLPDWLKCHRPNNWQTHFVSLMRLFHSSVRLKARRWTMCRVPQLVWNE